MKKLWIVLLLALLATGIFASQASACAFFSWTCVDSVSTVR